MENNNKQTPVEWLEQKIKGDKIFSLDVVIDKAKKMEKENLVEFFMFFRDNGEKFIGTSIEEFVEIYYNQNFK